MKLFVLSILIGTIFFVFGQVFLRKSFEKGALFLDTWLLFSLSIGICAFLFLCGRFFFYDQLPFEPLVFDPLVFDPLVAGLFFFFGNAFWIYSISTKNPIGNIRTIMAGFEMLLLFGAGYLFFHDSIHYIQFIGVLFTLLGIYLVGS